MELVAVTIAIFSNRWSPARLVLPISFTFALVITAVSFFYLGRFDTQKWSTYVWFVLYIVGIAVFAYYLLVLPQPTAGRDRSCTSGVANLFYGGRHSVRPLRGRADGVTRYFQRLLALED